MDQLTLCIFNSLNMKNYFFLIDSMDLLHFQKKKKNVMDLLHFGEFFFSFYNTFWKI